jgi:hypothetical protein
MSDSPERRATSPSKRWTTTASAANEDVTRYLAATGETSDCAQRAQRLKASKLNSTKGSISFGHEKVNYISDTHEQQLKAFNGEKSENREETKKRIKDMKTNLTTTNFSLGDEPVEYESTNREAMKKTSLDRDAMSLARPGLNKALKEAIKKSSLHFGNEPVNYKSVSQDGYVNKCAEGSANISNRKGELKEMKLRLTRHNFSLGEERIDYVSDYQSGFGVLGDSGVDKNLERANLKKQIEEIRKCHFTLGNDKVVYQSDAQRAAAVIAGHLPSDVAKSVEHAKAMKAALQKTSIVIGNDEEYM